ncbi:PASTA domain-containing protein [Brachyspira hampsonii]|uniref:Penicillin-binding protein n=1 Tax=Brachyspira hampsonii TaxID=1287055 RepID=A0AAC9TVL6_9SPIR|nr:PASTA domain-containing protein [Brachyspira hampsonii]ASJ22728.1 penicillin-binding protein [Brachyspira hampsonii]ELV06987.1 PASTA domain-containing protein [Brachyspira hampsonii 30599]MBW5379337.1 PASTA domain-containing protein [Brachyspira hampsonii]MBW5410993.1 PASTA domain-containing protein [Brachyspira hampsonii]OEJ19788.1 penicillin-binding protein [Brachyspira hampsonii]
MAKIKEFFNKLLFFIKKIINKILPDGIISDPKSFLVFKRLIVFAILLFVIQGIVVTLIVFIVVKSGGESFKLPDVQGKEIFEAFNLLEKEGMNLNVQTHYFDNYPLGTIVSQEPKSGVNVKRGRTVYLVVNVAEQAIVKMPDVTGMKYNEAVSIISNKVLNSMTNVNLLPKVNISDDMYENDVVLSQIPAADEVVGVNAEIILTVNKKESNIQ